MIFKGHLDIVWVKKVPPEKNTLPLEKKIIFSSKNEKKKKKKKKKSLLITRVVYAMLGRDVLESYPNDWTHTGEKPDRQGIFFSLDTNHAREKPYC